MVAVRDLDYPEIPGRQWPHHAPGSYRIDVSGPAAQAGFEMKPEKLFVEKMLEEVIEMAGPLASLFSKLSNQEQAAYASDVAQQADRLSDTKPAIAFPGRTWVAVGTR